MFWSVVFIVAVLLGLLLILTVFRKKLALNDKALHKQKLAYVAVGYPCLIALIIICFSNYGQLDIFNAQAQNNFMSLAKLPLIIVGLSTVLLGIVVNSHRTIQTSKQIEVATTKNKADLFISHYKMCLDNVGHINNGIDFQLIRTQSAIDIHRKDFGMKIDASLNFQHKKPNLLYSKFYPQNNLLSGAVDLTPMDITEDLESNIISFLESVTKLGKLQELGKYLFSRLDNAEKHILELGAPDYEDYVEFNTIIDYNGAKREVSPENARALFYSRLGAVLEGVFHYYQVSTSIEYSGVSGKISLSKFITNGFNGYHFSKIELPRFISNCFLHLVDLQLSMGAINSDARIRLCIRDFEHVLYCLDSNCMMNSTKR
ncbi:hypothetical protein [Rosenbergiella epipactidis]|uniref:hypothetical protein n=1 Tax=Rosenbergiella epipactidis TaxID=1544694 RepID=UPI001F4E2FED|nr:hypothetical protein [Rosenbergiella epipactidis]